MREDLGRELLLPELARSVNLSPSRFHQVFKAETGVSPSRYLRALRLGKAKELIENSFLSVKEIRGRVGAGDDSHFVRDFKKAYGLSPSKYREQHLGGNGHERYGRARPSAAAAADEARLRIEARPPGGDGRHAPAALHAAALSARRLPPETLVFEQTVFRPQPPHRRHPRFRGGHRPRPVQPPHRTRFVSTRRPRPAPLAGGARRACAAEVVWGVRDFRRLADPHEHPT